MHINNFHDIPHRDDGTATSSPYQQHPSDVPTCSLFVAFTMAPAHYPGDWLASILFLPASCNPRRHRVNPILRAAFQPSQVVSAVARPSSIYQNTSVAGKTRITIFNTRKIPSYILSAEKNLHSSPVSSH